MKTNPFASLPKILRPPKYLRVVLVGVPGDTYGVPDHTESFLMNKVWDQLRTEYVNTLGFPRPKRFDIRPWRAHGIWVFPWKQSNDLDRYMRLRFLSRNRDRLIFVCFGRTIAEVFPKYVDHRKHTVIYLVGNNGNAPATGDTSFSYIIGSNLYIRIAEMLRVSKSIFKLPVKTKRSKCT